MRGSGGTEGGTGKFLIGFGLSALALYLFFDSVRVATADLGWFTVLARRHAGGGLLETTSMGLVFVPFFLGVLALFYDARMKWAWGLMWFGVAVLVIEILSRVRFFLNMKTTHLLGMMVLFAAGAALMIRSYRDEATGRGATAEKDSETEPQKQEKQEKEKTSSRSEPPSES
ncbi:MAG TPA: hypothetical protein PLF81_13945 [Candidatus Anammoximicrobium sp.]|nr:hypothetical protein [Candidatus Anammoximicrobium sp.]